MPRSSDLPDCFYQNQPILISPSRPTPKHSLYLSNLDDQKFLRFSIKYLYLFRKSTSLDVLKYSLSRVLVDYYPLAGRLRTSSEDEQKLEIDCNGEGAVFAEAFMDCSADDFLEVSSRPNRSWRKLLYRIETHSFLDIPPLIVQVTSLRCGGMILCTAINHCLCDGIGTSQFLHAWAHITAKPNGDLPIAPFHSRHVLKPRNPPQIPFDHPGFTRIAPSKDLNLNQCLQSQPLVPTSLTFTPSHILELKRHCTPSLKCTTFEALASHTWRSWVKALDLGVKLVQQAKSALTDDNVKSMIDLLEDKTVKTDLSATLVISQWSKLGLEDLDFGEGKPLQMGPLLSDIYCLFLPVIGDFDATRVLLSVPECAVDKFEYYMKDLSDRDDYDVGNGYEGEDNGLMI
ncbi:unnamed protein product, partial [Vitis vinifera]